MSSSPIRPRDRKNGGLRLLGILRQDMSQEDVEILAGLNEVFNRGDVNAAMEAWAPDAELRDLANAPDQPSVVRGAEAIRETWLLWTAELEDFKVEVEEWIDAGDAVIVRAHWHGRGKGSGASIDHHQFDLWKLRDGKVVQAILGFGTSEDALGAARLAE
jgi:ketosteroid isomerase-like protein